MDRQLRELHKRWELTGDIHDELSYLQTRVRTESLEENPLAFLDFANCLYRAGDKNEAKTICSQVKELSSKTLEGYLVGVFAKDPRLAGKLAKLTYKIGSLRQNHVERRDGWYPASEGCYKRIPDKHFLPHSLIYERMEIRDLSHWQFNTGDTTLFGHKRDGHQSSMCRLDLVYPQVKKTLKKCLKAFQIPFSYDGDWYTVRDDVFQAGIEIGETHMEIIFTSDGLKRISKARRAEMLYH